MIFQSSPGPALTLSVPSVPSLRSLRYLSPDSGINDQILPSEPRRENKGLFWSRGERFLGGPWRLINPEGRSTKGQRGDSGSGLRCQVRARGVTGEGFVRPLLPPGSRGALGNVGDKRFLCARGGGSSWSGAGTKGCCAPAKAG